MRTLRRSSGQELYTVYSVDYLFTLTVVEADYQLFAWTGTLVNTQTREQVASQTTFTERLLIGTEVSIAREMLNFMISNSVELIDNPKAELAVRYLVSLI
jgi:hypothetical protein